MLIGSSGGGMNGLNGVIEHNIKKFAENTTILENGVDIVSGELSAQNALNPIPAFKLFQSKQNDNHEFPQP